MSRVIGYVYLYASYATSFLSLLSIVLLVGGHFALKCAAAEQHCRISVERLAGWQGTAIPAGESGGRCRLLPTRTRLVTGA